MNKELTQKLFDKYPKIFVQKDLPPTESLMCFGFECGDGWFWLIDNLCEKIQCYIDNNKHLDIPQVEAVQVKQKFGELRFYCIGGNEYIRGFIDFASYLSYNICERCGCNKDVKTTKRWITPLCKFCMRKYNFRNYVESIKQKVDWYTLKWKFYRFEDKLYKLMFREDKN